MSDDDFNLDAAMAVYEVSVPLHVGRAVISWNTLAGAFFQIYQLLSGMDMEAAKATFFCVASDRSQRDMVSELANLKLKPKNPKLAKQVQGLLGRANQIAGKRNDILHVVYNDTLDPQKVNQFHERGHLRGYSGSDLLTRIHSFTMETMELASQTMTCTMEIMDFQRDERLLAAQPLPPSIGLQWPQGQANQGEFGLLALLATNPTSPDGTQEQEEDEDRPL